MGKVQRSGHKSSSGTNTKRKMNKKWMTEDILDLMEQRRQVKNNRQKYETLHKEISKKCDEAKEKWIIDKCRNIELHHRCTEQKMYKNIEEI